MAELFQVGQRGWLKLTLATQPTGTVTNVGGVGEIDGEIPVWVRMDQHFLIRDDPRTTASTHARRPVPFVWRGPEWLV